MKKLLFYLTFIFNIIYSQNTLSIDNELENFVEEFVKDGESRGYYVRGILINRVDSIKINNNLKYPTLGEVRFKDSLLTVNIARFTLMDDVIVRNAIWHELGHVLLLNGNHKCKLCDHIMSSSPPKSFKPYYDPKNWEIYKKEFWEWILKNLTDEK